MMNDNYLIPVIGFYKEIMSYGKGSYIYDKSGKKYLDLNAGQFCSVLGNANPELIKYLDTHSNSLFHTNTEILTIDVITAAKNVNRISGNLNAYSIFLSTGAEAVEFSLRYAKHITKKEGIICFNKGYHGLTLGAQSVTFAGVYASPKIPNIYNVRVPDILANPEDLRLCLQEFEHIVKSSHNNIAAAIFEPIVSVGGMIIPPKEYFETVRSICDKYKILLIFDECQTGFGRTGTWFYYQQLNCIPDIVVCAKAIGLGYPVSVVMFNSTLVDSHKFDMTHYSSHQNDGLATLIINFGIDYIENNNILREVILKGDTFLNELKALEERCPHVKNARGVGLMLGIDLLFETTTDYRHTYRILSEKALKNGLVIQGTNGGKTLRFLPNYLIAYDEIKFCVDVLEFLLNS